MITNQIARERIEFHAKGKCLKSEWVKLENAYGRILAADCKSKINNPSFNQSAMDGFAVWPLDGTEGECRVLHEENPAGGMKVSRLSKGEAVRIYTGARVPDGSKFVVPIEQCREFDGKIYFNLNQFKINSNIRLIGEHFSKGERILRKGTLILSEHLGLLAMMGFAKIKVSKQPRITLIVSGNELIAPGKPLRGDKIYESNSFMLKAQLQQANLNNVSLFRVPDSDKKLSTVFKRQFQKSDVILFSGGISVGKFDLVKKILDDADVETIFYKIAQKPGKPLLFGSKGKLGIFGLPGNPAAAYTCMIEYVLPYLKGIQGMDDIFPVTHQGVLTNSFAKKKGLRCFLKAKFENGFLTILPDQESNKINSLSEANCFVVAEEDAELLNKGSRVSFHFI